MYREMKTKPENIEKRLGDGLYRAEPWLDSRLYLEQGIDSLMGIQMTKVNLKRSWMPVLSMLNNTVLLQV